MFVIDNDADGSVDDNVYFALTDNITANNYDNIDLSIDDNAYGTGNLTDGILGAGNDERIPITALPYDLRLGDYYTFAVAFDNEPPADAVDAWIKSKTWFYTQFTIDNDADGLADDTVYFALVDIDSDGFYENMDVSTDDNIYGEGTLNDLLTASDNDERLAASGIHIWLGAYRFLIEYDFSPAVGTEDVKITNRCWYHTTFAIDADADGAADDDAHFVLTDVNSDGVYENVDISVDDDTYGENAAALADNVADENNDERATASKDVRLDTYLFTVAFDNNPAADTNDVRITSKSWYFGTVLMDVDGDGSADDNVNFCLSDDDSNGVFNVLEISADDNTYGENAAALADNVADENNDERLTAPENLRIGPYYDYTIVALVSNPPVASPDFSLRSRSWYVGTIELVGNFKFVIWDNNSDGVFDRLTFDAKSPTDNYTNETSYSTAPSSISLPDGSAYVYRVLEFSSRPAYTDPDLRMQPLDNSPPELENLEPAQGAFVNTRSPTIRARLWDTATAGIKFGIDPDSIQVKVNDNVVSHTFTDDRVVSVPTLPEDGHVLVIISARDLARNGPTSIAWSFTVDTLKPSLAVEAPASGLVTEERMVVVSGTVSDLNFDKLLINGVEKLVTDNQFSAGVELTKGLNIIQVVARDKAGNTSIVSIEVTREAPPSPAVYLIPVVVIAAIVAVAVILFIGKRATGIPTPTF
jgi:hypothetical protein